MRDKDRLKRDAFVGIQSSSTRGGTRSATHQAEEQMRRGGGLNPLVDPKGPAHLGPIRRSLPRFEKRGRYWQLVMGMPMAEETLLDTTGSMGSNVDIAFKVLPDSYEMLTTGAKPILDRYDPQIATGIFNDVEDGDHVPVFCRSQFEMGEKIALQMTNLVPGRGGQGNYKEDPQFGLFGAAYLTDFATFKRYGLKSYHFTVSDEPIVPTINPTWLKKIFGDDVLDHVKDNGFDFGKKLPRTEQVVKDLQSIAHAFFLQVGNRQDVTDQWTDLYGDDHVIMLPGGTSYLHCIKATIIGLTEGVLDLTSAVDFLREHKVGKSEATQLVRAIAHIPLAAQAQLPNFDKLPMAGDYFENKTDIWPVDPAKINLAEETEEDEIKW